MSRETIIITMVQEVMFDLYDVSNGERTMSKGFAKELAEKLEEVEGSLKFLEVSNTLKE
tara:strand:+ start:1362 stop:1538 length:177 start_codon:yes stop_codon:yes gene_type:complete